MRTLYIDCGMGAAGDMLTAALLELLPDREGFLNKLNHMGLPGVTVSAEKSVKCGITGTHIRVSIHGTEEDEHLHDHSHDHSHSHSHGSMDDIRSIVSRLRLPAMVKLDVLAVYGEIAAAESHVHGVSVDQIHFHEVGNLDAVADIAAVCLLMHQLKPDQVVVSPIHVGSGTVRCAHGILPVPAPATAHILRGIPVYGGAIQSELCTPTGAALLKHFADRFGELPVMKTEAIGYGMGKKDFPRANCVRVLLGETADKADTVAELCCNVDDMTGEAMGFAVEKLMAAGALDAFTVPIGMKKSRPGWMLCVLCREEDREKMAALMFKHTTTIGVRESHCSRYVLDRKTETVQTEFGPVRKKVSFGYGVRRSKYEYGDLAKIAGEQGLSLGEILEKIEKM